MGQPDTSDIEFYEHELEGIDDETFMKIESKMIRLRERIESQCKINLEHDKLHD